MKSLGSQIILTLVLSCRQGILIDSVALFNVVISEYNRITFYRVDDAKISNHTPESSFQVAASWQANKNFLLKVLLSILCE